MEFKTFLRICKTYFMSELNVSEFMMNFFYDLASVEDDPDENEACPFQKETNVRKATKVFYGERPMSRDDATFMRAHFNEDALIEKIDKLDERVQQNLVDELAKNNVETNLINLQDTMCNLFRQYMEEMSERKGGKVKKIQEKNEQPTNKKEEITTKKEKPIFDSRTMELARNFCIDHEEEKELIVLCQIADYIAPLHRHVRSMYTDYLKQNDEVKKAIMFLNNIPILEFETNWEYMYLDEFRKDIKKLNLVTDKDLLYEGGKYFHYACKYADEKIEEPNPRIFPAVPRFFTKGDLTNYIDEYVYYKNDEERFSYVSTPPFDWMIDNLELLSCPEDELAFWMCMFIRSACYIIPREIPERHKIEEDLEIDEDDSYYPTPELKDVTRMEDLYYLTLYVLHGLYS